MDVDRRALAFGGRRIPLLARKNDGARQWPVRLATAKKAKEFGPDAVKNAAAALGLKPSESLTRVLEENAKAEKAARKADK